jgi:hypothetical protein
MQIKQDPPSVTNLYKPKFPFTNLRLNLDVNIQNFNKSVMDYEALIDRFHIKVTANRDNKTELMVADIEPIQFIITTNAIASLMTIQEALGDEEEEEDYEVEKEMQLKYHIVNRTGYPIKIGIPD